MIQIRTRFHTSWLITALSFGILLGGYLSLHLPFFGSLIWLLFPGCIIFGAFKTRNLLAIILIILAGGFIGGFRGSLVIESQMPYESYIESEVVVSGRVAGDPTYSIDGDLRLLLRDVLINNTQVGGEIWISTTDSSDIKRSDEVVVRGRIDKGFGTIPAAMYRARISKVERRDYADVGRDVRDWFAAGIRRAIVEPEASLGAGFLVGQKTALPEKLDQELRLLGLTHIVVASGYNLSILVRGSRRVFARISRFSATAVSSLLVLGFLQITGYSPSMVRASLITLVSLAAWFYGRRLHPVVLLISSAAVTVAINPSYIWGDIGWLLSFLSFIGVIIFAPLVQSYFWGEQKPNFLRQIMIETLSAQLITMPIIVMAFGKISPLALLANILIVPLIPLTMLMVALGGIGGMFPLVVAKITGWPAERLLSYMTYVVDYLARFPAASIEISISIVAVVVSYIVLVILAGYMYWRSPHQFRNYNIIE